MMSHKQNLIHRLEQIAQALQREERALALIGLGSAGRETDRLDAFSDLDFFVITREGGKQPLIEQLDWLASPSPLVFSFRNTPDGCKALSADGIFYEFAVFTPAELPGIPYAPGRMVWRREGVPDTFAVPTVSAPSPHPPSHAWQLGEALSNLYVGLCRYHRGEKLSAFRFVQCHAVDRVLALLESEGPEPTGRDPFSIERRFEQRHPDASRQLAVLMSGYDRTPEAALALLDFLCARYDVPAGMAVALRRLAAYPEDTPCPPTDACTRSI